MFCSQACRGEAMNTWHKVECSLRFVRNINILYSYLPA